MATGHVAEGQVAFEVAVQGEGELGRDRTNRSGIFGKGIGVSFFRSLLLLVTEGFKDIG